MINDRQKQLAQRLIMKQQATRRNGGGRYLPPGRGVASSPGTPFHGMGASIKGHFTPPHTAMGGISQRIIDAMGIGGRGFAGRDFGSGPNNDIGPYGGMPSPGGAGGGYMPPPAVAPDAPGGSIIHYPNAPTQQYQGDPGQYTQPGSGTFQSDPTQTFGGGGGAPAGIDPALLFFLQQQMGGGYTAGGGGGGVRPGSQM